MRLADDLLASEQCQNQKLWPEVQRSTDCMLYSMNEISQDLL